MSATRNQQLDHDQLYCPISRQIMRHPVKVMPSERYYELAMLVQWIKNGDYYCPLTRKPIFKVIDAEDIKKRLDTLDDQTERYEEYDHENLFQALNHSIYQHNWEDYKPTSKITLFYTMLTFILSVLACVLLDYIQLHFSDLLYVDDAKLNRIKTTSNIFYPFIGLLMSMTYILVEMIMAHVSHLAKTLENEAGRLSKKEIILHEIDQMRQRIPYEITKFSSAYQQSGFFSTLKTAIHDKIETINEYMLKISG